MKDYKPWSKKIANSINNRAHNEFVTLDIQFGGACNMHCVYCDTPQYGEPCLLDLGAIEKIIKEGNIEWIHSCGLGEPTNESDNLWENNIHFLIHILEMCKQYGSNMTIFSNLLNLPNAIKDYVDNGILNIVYKYDTSNIRLMQYLYGITEEQAKKLILNRESLMEVHHLDEYGSNLAFSTVPLRDTLSELPSIIDFGEETEQHYLLGQLENVGKASSCSNCKSCTNCGKKASFFEQQFLMDAELYSILKYIKAAHGFDYELSPCTGAYSAMHINNSNQIICDELTGLSCPWPLLEEPRLKILGDIRTMSQAQLTRAYLDYRKERLPAVEELSKNIQGFPIGSCGGNLKTLIKDYASTVRKQDNIRN